MDATRTISKDITYPLDAPLGDTPGLGNNEVVLPTIQSISYETESTTYFNALTASGLTLTDARKYTLNRAIKRWKAAGLHTKVDFGIALSADAFAISVFGLVSPSKIGTPTFSNYAVSSTVNTNGYDLNVQFKNVDLHDHSMGFIAVAGSTGNANFDMGVYDGTSLRLGINAKNTSNLFQAGSFTSAQTYGSTSLASGNGFNAISRHPADPDNNYNYVNGIMRVTKAVAATATTSTNTIQILKTGGLTTISSRSLASWFFGKGLTHAEMAQVYAILKSIDNGIRYGEPQIQDAGYGDSTVSVDALVIGWSVSSVIAAYRAKQLGYTVALLGKERDTSPEHIGFNPVGYADVNVPATWAGLSRAMITAANTLASLADTNDQQGLSIHPVWWNRISRQMLDPTLSSATPVGRDIKVYASTGIRSITMATNAIGNECTQLVTNDGRIFQPAGTRMIIVSGDYDGDIIPLLGVSYTKGTEARGSAPGENLNGFDATALFHLADAAGNHYDNVDPYITPGVSSSGLLPDVEEIPSTADGAPDAILQPFNFRLMVTSTATRQAPLTGGATLTQPPGYDALRYEKLGRLFAAITAAARTPALGDIFVTNNSVTGVSGTVFDWNNGPSGIGTDLGGMGARYLAAVDNAAREVEIQDLREWTQGYFYWLLASGDSRIPSSLVTALSGYGLDTAWGVDPHPNDPLFWPVSPYKREPVYQLKNTFNYSANDTFATDGTTPRSVKTVACGDYRADVHSKRWVNNGGALFRLSAINDSSAGGTDQKSPLPLEAIVPDKAECTNFISTVSLGVTKVANASVRMEHVFHGCSEAAAYIIDLALTNGVAVQDVDYSALRTAMLAAPDGSTYVLPQTN